MKTFLQSLRKPRILKLLNFLIGAGLCASVAVFVCLIFPISAQRAAVPMIFTLVIIAMAMRFGAGAGVLGCLLSAIIFALFLFKPMGSVAIANPSAKSNLLWMILLGVPGSYLFAPIEAEPAKDDKQSK